MLNGDPKDLIRAMPAKGDRPAGRFLTGRPSVMARAFARRGTRYGAPGLERLPYRGRLRTVISVAGIAAGRIAWVGRQKSSQGSGVVPGIVTSTPSRPRPAVAR